MSCLNYIFILLNKLTLQSGGNEMMKSVFSSLFSFLLLSSVVVQAATISVGPRGCDHIKITDALEDAISGDVIKVKSGIYKERVVVDMPLSLVGVDIGDGAPIIDAGGAGSAITLSSDGCELKGFVIKNSGSGKAGIKINSNRNILKENQVIENKWYGMYLENSSFNIISGNVIRNNKYGIWFTFDCDHNQVSRNLLLENSNYNAMDLGDNLWKENTYGDFDEDDGVYHIPGGSNVDRKPKATENSATKPSTAINVKITIPTPIIEVLIHAYVD